MTKYVPPLRWTAAALTVLSLTGLTTAEAAVAPASPVAAASSHSRTPDLDAAPDVIATDIQMPWGLAFLPGGDVLITERQTSRILRIGPGHEPELVRTIPDVYIPGGTAAGASSSARTACCTPPSVMVATPRTRRI